MTWDEIEDMDGVADLFNSEEFKSGFRKLVERDTWGRGLPMINGDYQGNVWATYEDGRKELLCYKKEGVTFELPCEFNRTDKLRGRWEHTYVDGCYVSGENEEEIMAELMVRRTEFEAKQQKWDDNYVDDAF